MAELMLSLCIVAKDEEKNIARCIESMDGLAGEIILVDTGSTDRTVEIAGELGAKVFYQAWQEDFSRAKNFALEQAGGEWVMFMDADDVLSREGREQIPGLTRETDVDGFLLQTVSYLGKSPGLNRVTNLQVRLLRNLPQFRYQGRIHERILSEPGRRVKAVPLKIYHYGYLDGEVSGKSKIQRNLKILREVVRQEPRDLFNRFNLGMEYLRAGSPGQAKGQLEKVWRRSSPEVGYFPDLVGKLAWAYLALGEREASLAVLARGIESHPDFTDLYLLQGRVCQEMGKYALAARAFETCLSKGEAPFLYSSALGSGSFLAWNALGDLARELYDYRRAAGYYLESLTCAAQQPEVLAALLQVVGKFMGLSELREFIQANFDLEGGAGYARLASALLAADQPELAREIISRINIPDADDRSQHEGLSYLRGQYLLKSGCFEQACQHLRGITRNSPFYTEAITSLCVLDWLMQAWPRAEEDLRSLKSAPGAGLRARLFRVIHVYLYWGKVRLLKLNRQEEAEAQAEMLALLRWPLQLRQKNLLAAICGVVESMPGWEQGLTQAAQVCIEYGAFDSALDLLSRAGLKAESGPEGDKEKKNAGVKSLISLLQTQCYAATGKWSAAWAAFQPGEAAGPAALTWSLGRVHTLGGMAEMVVRQSSEPRPGLARGLRELLTLFPLNKT